MATTPVRRVGRIGAGLVVLGVVSSACGSTVPGQPSAAAARTTVSSRAATSASPPSSGVAGAPEVGTTVQRLTGDSIHVIGSALGFTAVELQVDDDAGDKSTITTYDVAGTRLAQISAAGNFSGDCGAADVVTPAGRVVITALITRKPAEGVNPPQYALELDAWNAQSGERAWQAALVPSQTDEIGCGYSTGRMENLGTTRDGKWGVYVASKGGKDVPEVVDLATGTARTTPGVTGVLGNYLLGHDGDSARIVDPASGHEINAPDRSIRYGDGAYAADTPVFAVAAGQTSPRTGLTSDGAALVSYPDAPAEDPVTAYRLPDLKPLWTIPIGSNVYDILADSGGMTILGLHAPDYAANDKLIAFDDRTGQRKWDIPMGDICGLTTTQMLISVNEQLAVIDLAGGKQVSFTDASHDCPAILPSGISVTDTDGGLTVTQTLTP